MLKITQGPNQSTFQVILSISKMYARTCPRACFARAHRTYCRDSDFPRSRKTDGIRGNSLLKRKVSIETENHRKHNLSLKCTLHRNYGCKIYIIDLTFDEISTAAKPNLSGNKTQRSCCLLSR